MALRLKEKEDQASNPTNSSISPTERDDLKKEIDELKSGLSEIKLNYGLFRSFLMK